jgi:hypothetical protein
MELTLEIRAIYNGADGKFSQIFDRHTFVIMQNLSLDYSCFWAARLLLLVVARTCALTIKMTSSPNLLGDQGPVLCILVSGRRWQMCLSTVPEDDTHLPGSFWQRPLLLL